MYITIVLCQTPVRTATGGMYCPARYRWVVVCKGSNHRCAAAWYAYGLCGGYRTVRVLRSNEWANYGSHAHYASAGARYAH